MAAAVYKRIENKNMRLIATGLTGTIGRKLSNEVQSARIRLGDEKLGDHFAHNEEPLTLIHLGGIVGEGKVSQNLELSERINVGETIKLAREVIENLGGRFIHISSSHVYGPHTGDLFEESPMNPQSKYAEQKMRAEQELTSHFGVEHPQLVILRVFSVLGWDVASFTLGGAIKRILEGSSERIASSDDVRDFMTPTSIAKVIYEVAKSHEINGVFNLCTGKGISVREAVSTMVSIKNFELESNQLESGFSKSPRIVGSNTKILSRNLAIELAWEPANDTI
jgi:nucleoside-diphosphate-sugar epimerase